MSCTISSAGTAHFITHFEHGSETSYDNYYAPQTRHNIHRKMKFYLLSLLLVVSLSASAFFGATDAYHKHKHGQVKIKVWRGPSHGHKGHKHAPFGYHFSIEEKGH